jgi:hypothetical protein
MKLTNKHGLPDAFVRFLKNDKYSRGDANISVTTLIDSPRINKLREWHQSDMEMDVSDRLWALLGTAAHHILEQAEQPDVVTEERMYWKIFDWTLSGAVDVQQYMPDGSIKIIDYKVCSAWSVMNEKPDWERQLNCYAYLVRKCKELSVSGLQICAILRDWNRRKAETETNYPDCPVVMVDVPLWEPDVQDNYIEERVSLHKDTQERFYFAEPIPLCTDEERWAKPSKWAVMKNGRKSAVKLFDDERHAKLFIGNQKSADALYIEHRPGSFTRCEGNFCGVAEFCNQFKGDKS